MTPANAKIIKCPYCGTEKELMSLGSANNIGAQYWSDLREIAPMKPVISPVQKCAECGKYFLEKKQERTEGDMFSSETGGLSFYEWKEAYSQFCSEEGATIGKEDMINIRGWLLQAYNDYYYRGPGKHVPSEEEHRFIVGVINRLVESIDWIESIDPLFPGGVSFGNPAEGYTDWVSKKSPLVKAELLREAGELQKCYDLLVSLEGKSIDNFDNVLFKGIVQRLREENDKVFKFYDESEARQADTYQGNTLKNFHKCPNGHYYRGLGPCPYCTGLDNTDAGKSRTFSKVCINHHCYSSDLDACPICGSSVVIDKYDWAKLTVVMKDIPLGKTIDISVNGKWYTDINYVRIEKDLSRNNKCRYGFCKNNDPFLDGYISINPDDDIWIGCSLIKGREVMRMCDVILDNQLSIKCC